MWNVLSVAYFILFCSLQIWNVKCKCRNTTELTEVNSTISVNATDIKSTFTCWKILNPEKVLIRLRIEEVSFKESCEYTFLRIYINETGDEFKFCDENFPTNVIIAHSDIDIVYKQHYVADFGVVRMRYETDYGLSGVKDIEKARSKAISLLWEQFSFTWKWIDTIPKAIIGFYLSGGNDFNNNLTNMLMLEQRDLRISIALLRGSLTIEQASVYVNSLLVSCHNPKRFYGRDFIRKLKDETMGSSDYFIHPSIYLALCNANEAWPLKALKDIKNILNNTDSEYLFLKDIQAFAVMAVSCELNRTSDLHSDEELMLLYRKRIDQFKKNQLPNGSFGNVHTTSLVTQALLASGEEHEKDWKVYGAIKYLIEQLDSPNFNFLSNYLILPLLNGKTLVDIAHVNCSGRLRDRDDSIFEKDLGHKFRVKYSLFIGDNKDIIYTISFSIPENFTAYDVMLYAKTKDQKYEFLWERVSGKMYVYDISKIPNDPEERKFWLLYLSSKDATNENFKHITTSPDELIMEDGDHLVMWYKMAVKL